MEARAPKRKRGAPPFQVLSLPSGNIELVGIFNGLHVAISNPSEIHELYNKGNFGKGNLSRGAPVYHTRNDDLPRIIWKQQYNNESKWHSDSEQCCSQTVTGQVDNNYRLAEESIKCFLQSVFVEGKNNSWQTMTEANCSDKFSPKMMADKPTKKNCVDLLEFTEEGEDFEVDEYLKNAVETILETKQAKQVMNLDRKQTEDKVIVIDLENDFNADEQLLDNISAELKTRQFPIVETLQLNLEEALFLNFSLRCLKIKDVNNREMNANELWQKFCSVQLNFCEKYVVYHYYRTKGWIVRSGLKYGGDYLLYKNGPAYYHASYLVKILSKDTNLTWKEFFAANRLVETFNKDIIFCTVVGGDRPSSEEQSLLEFLQTFRVHEITSKRWLPSKERMVEKDDT